MEQKSHMPVDPTSSIPAEPDTVKPTSQSTAETASERQPIGAENIDSYRSAHSAAQSTFDTTGQVAPPGRKYGLTVSLWEEEGTLVFNVDVNNIVVTRREDSHMVNGTQLLDAAGVCKEKRDEILKSEKVYHLTTTGPMNFRGVWIPFERALDLANRERITEEAYPLFLYNPMKLVAHLVPASKL